jgi:hypothetical protein
MTAVVPTFIELVRNSAFGLGRRKEQSEHYSRSCPIRSYSDKTHPISSKVLLQI